MGRGIKMKAKVKVTAKKYNGDDAYSWAIFRSDSNYPVVAGLHKTEVQYYKKQVLAEINETSVSRN